MSRRLNVINYPIFTDIIRLKLPLFNFFFLWYYNFSTSKNRFYASIHRHFSKCVNFFFALSITQIFMRSFRFSVVQTTMRYFGFCITQTTMRCFGFSVTQTTIKYICIFRYKLNKSACVPVSTKVNVRTSFSFR